MNKYNKFWDNINPKYLLNYNREEVKLIKKDILGDLEPYDSILEYGCGAGRILDYIYEEGIFFDGVDFSQNMVNVAIEKFINNEKEWIRIYKNDGYHIPAPDNIYDFVYSVTVFQHMPTREIIIKTLNEIHRVIKKVARLQFSKKLPLMVESEGDQLHGYRMNITQLKELIKETNIKEYTIRTSKYLDANLWYVLEIIK